MAGNLKSDFLKFVNYSHDFSGTGREYPERRELVVWQLRGPERASARFLR
jgi:hypothetical protein